MNKSTLPVILSLFFLTFLTSLTSLAAVPSPESFKDLPDSIYVGEQTSGHVQGIAYDREQQCLYLSFTTRFLKVDREGNIIASIERMQGHLGAMAVSPFDGKIYASFECMDDEIGRGVTGRLGVEQFTREQSTFYIAVIDPAKFNRLGMDAEKDDVMKTFCVHPAGRDYKSGKYGCAGIDGVTFVPRKGLHFGKNKWQLCIAYGIYDDVTRTDNDCQILLLYNIRDYEKTLTSAKYRDLHQNGPQNAAKQYFIYTGNTRYGVQNLAYDAGSGKIFMAVYHGHKPQYTNADLFTLDWEPSKFATSYEEAVAGGQPLGGWHFKWGATGLCPMGDGLWYVSENFKDKVRKTQSCKARLYYWDPSAASGPFVKVSEIR